MTIKDLINVSIDQFPRLPNIYLGNEWPPHSHADHTGLDEDDHRHYMTNAAGVARQHTGDLYLQADLRGVTDLRLDDSYRNTHTVGGGDWVSDGIDLSASSGEWQSAYDLFGEERSILGLINGIAGLISGVTAVNNLDGDLIVRGGTYIDAQTSDPNITINLLPHAAWHQQNGDDEINVTELSGRLADDQYAGWFHSTTYPIAATAPTSGQSLVWTGSAWAPQTVSTSITGLTPQQLLFGSVTGTIAQSSGLTWDGSTLLVSGAIDVDSNQIENVHYIDFIANGVTAEEMRVWWNGDAGCLQVGMAGGTAELSIGLEMYAPRAKNVTGSVVANGTAVYMSGAVSGVPEIQVSDSSTGVDAEVYGVATEDIVNGSQGFATTDGILRDTDTDGYTAGDRLWLSTAGGYTGTRPDAPNASIALGWVVDVGETDGSMYVAIERIPYLSYLSDVHARSQTHTDGDVLAWDGGNNRWDLSTAVLALTSDSVTRVGTVNLYAGAGVLIDAATDGFTISALVADTIYTATSRTLVVGTELSGAYQDTWTVNLTGIEVQEVSGSPGYDLIFDFNAVIESFNRLQAHVLYSANTSHTVTVQMYNYTDSQWNSFTSFTASQGWQTIDVPVEGAADYINPANNARVRFYHAANGNASHEINHDYVALVKTGGAAGGGTIDDAYDFGGAGLGRTAIIDSGPVVFYTPVDSTSSTFVLSHLNPAFTANIFNLNNATLGASIWFSGSIGDIDGDADNARGHELWGENNSAISLGTTRYSSGADKASAFCRVAPYYDTVDVGRCIAELRAESETSPDYAFVRASAQGDSGSSESAVFMQAEDTAKADGPLKSACSLYFDNTNVATVSETIALLEAFTESDSQPYHAYVQARAFASTTTADIFDAQLYVYASGQVTLQSAAGSVLIDPDTYLSINGVPVRNARCYVGATSPTTPGFTAGVIDANFDTGRQIQSITVTAAVTGIAVTNPPGTGVFYLHINASGGSRDVENLTSGTSTPFTFIGNYDLNAEPVTLPSGKRLSLKMIYEGPTIGWSVQAVLEVL